jgi:hypothetical protein
MHAEAGGAWPRLSSDAVEPEKVWTSRIVSPNITNDA